MFLWSTSKMRDTAKTNYLYSISVSSFSKIVNHPPDIWSHQNYNADSLGWTVSPVSAGWWAHLGALWVCSNQYFDTNLLNLNYKYVKVN